MSFSPPPKTHSLFGHVPWVVVYPYNLKTKVRRIQPSIAEGYFLERGLGMSEE